MRKKIFILVILFFLSVPYKTYATVEYENEIRKIADDYNIPSEKITEITIQDIFDYFIQEVKSIGVQPIKTSTKLASVIILLAIVKTINDDDKIVPVSILDNICTLIIFINLLGPIRDIIAAVSENLWSVKNFMTTFLPVYAGISMASGEFMTSAVYSGFFLTAIIFFSNFCLNTILPSLQLYLALIISNALSPFIRLKSIGDFYVKSIKWIMSSIVSVICFILTVQTAISQGKDTVAVKAGKFFAGSAIPVIGSALQEAIGSVYSGMEAIKNFAGSIGLICIVSVFLPSLISLIVYWICTNFLYIINDMFDIKSIGQCIHGFTTIIELVISIVVLYMVMLIFSLTIMISITNGV